MNCKRCKNIVDDNASFCPVCGGNLKENDNSSKTMVMVDKAGFERPSMITNKKTFSLVVFFLGVLGIIFFCTAGYYASKKAYASNMVSIVSVIIGLILLCTVLIIENIFAIKNTMFNCFNLKKLEMQNDFDDKLRTQVIGFLDKYIEQAIEVQENLTVDLLIFENSEKQTGVLSITCLFFDADRELCIIQDHYQNNGYDASIIYDQARSVATFTVKNSNCSEP